MSDGVFLDTIGEELEAYLFGYDKARSIMFNRGQREREGESKVDQRSESIEIHRDFFETRRMTTVSDLSSLRAVSTSYEMIVVRLLSLSGFIRSLGSSSQCHLHESLPFPTPSRLHRPNE